MRYKKVAQLVPAALTFSFLPLLAGAPASAHVEVTATPDYQGVPHPPVVRLDADVANRYYKVRPGDTLSRIAARYLGGAWRWKGLWAANDGTVRNPNVIVPREHILLATGAVSSSESRYLRQLSAPWKDPAGSFRHSTAVAVHHYACGDGDGDGFDTPCWKIFGRRAVHHYQAPAAAPASPVVYGGGGYPGGAFGACVVARESGGNPEVMNATGHWGLYQFSAATWAAYGGNPADFGSAGVAEQNQVFANALAQGGQSNWSLYDGW